MFLLDNLGREIQEANALCWAAVSTMAVRAFPETDDFKHPTQRQTVIFHESGIKTVNDLRKAEDETSDTHERYEGFKESCSPEGSCNLLSSKLHLFDVKSEMGVAGQALTAEHFRIELGLRACPVPIRWRYEGAVEIDGTRRIGEHALIVTGYNPDKHELRIFDPWPSSDPTDEIADLAPALHEKWIPYDVYVDPRNDGGLHATAVHEFDQFMLRRVGAKDPKTQFHYPALMTVPPFDPHRGNCVDFDQRHVPDDLWGAIYKVMGRHVVRDSSGYVIHGPYDPGRPIPIVGLKASQVVGCTDHYSLFSSMTSTVAVPVLRHGRMIDSFLMLHDKNGWKAGGYSNNQITSLLCEARKILEAKPDKGRIYLVSIPELSAFFVAQGFLNKASIAGLCRNPKHCASSLGHCGSALDELVAKARNDARQLTGLRKKFGSSLD